MGTARDESRLERLERQVRQTRLVAGVALGVVVLLGAFLLVSRAGVRGLEVQQLRLVDEQGRLVGTFGADEAGVALTVRDADGVERVRVGLVREIPSVLLSDEFGNMRLVLESAPPGPGLALFGSDGRASAHLADEEGAPLLSSPTGRALLDLLKAMRPA